MKKYLIILIVTLLVVAGCNASNTSKSETKKDSIEPKIVNLMIEKVDDSDFYVVTTAEGNQLNYAYYVFKNNEIFEKFPYKKDAHFSYSAKEPGIYKVRSYIKDLDGNIVREDTEEIEINL